MDEADQNLGCSSRLETHIKELQGKMEKKKGEIIQVQTSAQAAGPQAVKA
jgi:prefoldin beta subunit